MHGIAQLINRLPALVILIGAILVAVALGIVLIYVVTFIEKKGRWEQLESPPGDIIKLLAGDVDQVIVETANGTTYEVYCGVKDEFDSCWRETEVSIDMNRSACDYEGFPKPPSRVKDRLQTCIGYEFIILSQYVLNYDGTLWRWNVGLYPYGQLSRAIQIIFISFSLGIIVGVVVLVSRR